MRRAGHEAPGSQRRDRGAQIPHHDEHHLHEDHESAIYVISGRGEFWWGPALEHHEVVEAGDFIHIPAGVPHLPANRSETEPCEALVARTDASEQESVVLLPELESVVPR